MNWKLLFLFISLLILSFVSGQNTTKKSTCLSNNKFEKLLDKSQLLFESPKSFTETKPRKNCRANYEKSYMHNSEDFEVRYKIVNHTSESHKEIFEKTVLAISKEGIPNYKILSPSVVKKEFGGDAGYVVDVDVVKQFGKKFNHCLLVYIHKKRTGDTYMFYMSNGKKNVLNLMKPIFHSLKFKSK